jgi:TonB family protein
MEADDEDERGFFARHRVLIVGISLVVVGAGVWMAFFGKSEPKKSRSSASIVNITLPPPPPPPPTPVPTPPPPQEPVEQPVNPDTPEFVEETQPDSAPEPQEAPPAEALGSNIQGDGPPDGFGLTGRGGNGLIGGTGTGKGTGGGGSKYGAYAGKVQRAVADALRSHKKVKTASLTIQVRVWADATGRITRVRLAQSTGDAELDRAISEEALANIQLPEAPPADMPMPIVMRITAKRPN